MASETDFGPIRALFDPQSFAEKLFRGLKGSRESFDTKLLLMRLLSRVASCHELVLGGYYSFLGRYMQPHQSNVTRVLAYLVQACHANVPPTFLSPCVTQLENNFLTDRNSPQAIVAGLNTMREMFARQPAIIDEALVKEIVSQVNK